MDDGSGSGRFCSLGGDAIQEEETGLRRLHELLSFLEEEHDIVATDNRDGEFRILHTHMQTLRSCLPALLAEIEELAGNRFTHAEPDHLNDVGREDPDWVLSLPASSCGDTYGQVQEEGSEDDPEDDPEDAPYYWWLS